MTTYHITRNIIKKIYYDIRGVYLFSYSYAYKNIQNLFFCFTFFYPLPFIFFTRLYTVAVFDTHTHTHITDTTYDLTSLPLGFNAKNVSTCFVRHHGGFNI